MADTNRVLFGFSQVHVGTYEIDPLTKAVSLGTPYHQEGAVGFSPENQGESVDFFADKNCIFQDKI